MRRATHGPPRATRRATVLFAVLFLVVLASLSATTMLTAVAAERAAVTRELEQIQLVAAARSALLVYKAEFAGQRDAMLEGGAPTLPGEIRIDMGEDEPAVIVRLVPFSDGSTTTPEPARLDLNHATAAMLGSLPGMTTPLAERLVAERESVPYLSPTDALGVEGASVLINATDSSGPEQPESFGDERIGALDLLTVYSFEPRLQAGLGGDDYRGVARININAPWSDNIERAFEQQMSEQAAATATGLFIAGPKIEKPSDLVRLLIDRAVPRNEWPALLDALTTSAERYRPGCVDINTATRAVLATLPGLSETLAEDLVTVRERLGAPEKRSVTWPLDEGVLTAEQFADLVDHAVTRSLQWRVILRVSFEPIDEMIPPGFDPDDAGGGLLPEADEFGVATSFDDARETPEPCVILEAVFDAANERTRIAYLRDRTAYSFVVQLAALPGFGGEDRFTDSGFNGDGYDPDEMMPYDESDPDASPMTLDDLTASYFDDDEEESEAGFGGLEFDEFGFFDDEPIDDDPPIGPGLDEPDRAADPGESSPGDGDPSRSVPGGDNRLGRWTPARKGGS
ncbi:MAG: helix-hairpin-helix domain-containing protein [Phycisphaerales bacterium]|nr:helix-hairpin-helix domain-containing protein [Phycisphaerales bacterium]